MQAESAPAIVQERVECSPEAIEAGLAVNAMIVGGATVDDAAGRWAMNEWATGARVAALERFAVAKGAMDSRAAATATRMSLERDTCTP